jgi:GH25 family lysozyme M1 (1,4-beta-N-acetylmuramidase)
MIVSQGGVDDFNWTGNPHRWSQAQKIKSLSSPFALQVVLILDQLEAEGFQPSIRLAWRDLEAQRKLVRENKSDSAFSYHNVVDGNARPAGLAIDAYDRRYGWGEAGPSALRGAARFFKRLGELARAQGLGWGGDPKRYNIDRSGNAWKPYGMGWDPGHVFDDVPDWKGVKLASLNALTEPQVMAAAYGGTGYGRYGATSGQVVGIDVSHHQKKIDWSAVAQDPQQVRYVFLKVTEGGSGAKEHTDSRIVENARGAKSQGLPITYYHFARPSDTARKPLQADAIDEADFFLRRISELDLPEADFPLILDLEVNDNGLPPPQIARWSEIFLDQVERRTGVKPMFYSYSDFLQGNVTPTPKLSSYPLWLAHYTTSAAPRVPHGYSDPAVWQYSSTGKVRGIYDHAKERYRDVDMNKTTPEKLQALMDLAVPARRAPSTRAPSTRAPVTSSGGGGGGGGMAILLLGGIAAAVIAGSSK